MAGEWIAQLPGDLQANETFTQFETIGDLGKSYLETTGKLSEFEGKVKEYEGKITDLQTNSIPKLPADATPEQREAFYKALGRPDKADEYEFLTPDGKPADTNVAQWARGVFHEVGMPKDMAKAVGQKWNEFLASVEKADMELRQKEKDEAMASLKSELGDKYDESYELANRFWKEVTNEEFESFLNDSKIGNDARLIKFVMGCAKKTAEDTSVRGDPSKGQNEDGTWFPNTKWPSQS